MGLDFFNVMIDNVHSLLRFLDPGVVVMAVAKSAWAWVQKIFIEGGVGKND